MSEAFNFLGFRLHWKRKRGTNKWYVYTFIAARSIRAVKAKIRAATLLPILPSLTTSPSGSVATAKTSPGGPTRPGRSRV